jgi:hypothetical protein
MNPKLWILFLCLAAGCSGHLAPPPLPSSGEISTHADYGLEALREACQSIPGARFREYRKECECPGTQMKGNPPELFQSVWGARCESPEVVEPPAYDNDCQGSDGLQEAYLQGGIDQLNRCTKSILRFHRTSLGFQVGALSRPAAMDFARWLDSARSGLYAKLWATPEDLYFNSSITVLVGRVRIDDNFIRELVAAPSVGEKQRYHLTVVEPDPAAVGEVLGHPIDVPKPLPEAPAPIQDRFPLAAIVKQTYDRLVADNLNTPALRVGGDCRHYCVIEQVLYQEGDWRAVRQRHYMGGVPFRDVVRYGNGIARAYLQLGLRGGVSTITFLEGSDRFLVYDRQWNLIGDQRFDSSAAQARARDFASRVPVATSPAGRNVGFCESLPTNEGLTSAVVRGPVESSLLGWTNHPFDGLLDLIDGVFLEPENTHGQAVAETLIDTFAEAKLIPLSTETCLTEYPRWAPTLQRAGVKVMTLSGTIPVDTRWCDAFYDPQRYLGPNQPFLWVVAAGNAGQRNPNRRCPQTTPHRDNLLVVAGGEDRLWSGSDYGVDYADLAASPKASRSADVGTSFSAPRVAAVAAQLADRFPSLTPEDLKNILMKSAHVPSPSLDVRSGGALDACGARGLGEAVGRLSVEQRRSLTDAEWKRLAERNPCRR